MSDNEKMEEQISKVLTEGDMSLADPQTAAVQRLRPRWEIRIRAERDPIVEETARYREIAQEADDRYDAYISGGQAAGPGRSPDTDQGCRRRPSRP